MILRRYLAIIKTQFRILLRRLREDHKYQLLLASIKNYVPKYYKRSGLEHQAIRDHIIKRQDRCTHLKGGAYCGFKDYNVMQHTYIDKSVRIRCGNCGKIWTPESADWLEAIKMHDLSSNRPSSSETPPYVGELSVLRAELASWDETQGYSSPSKT